MITRNKNFVASLCLCTAAFLTACDNDDDKDNGPSLNIVETADSVDDLSSLVTAVSAFEDIATALSDPDADLTVFAPTNAAFDGLCETLGVDGTGDTCVTGLVDALTADTVADVLTYHVLGNRVDAATAVSVAEGEAGAGRLVPTLLEGNSVAATLTGNQLYINTSAVTTADVDTTNGVVHVIDKVLLPVELETITDFSSLTIAEIVAAASTGGATALDGVDGPEFTLL
ncbi:MAG: fasciclin domain-containing protein, partial [Pseudomonadales bacterium]|nr:fasciclin domain-containing protein [Pseudomonadales bacterium]